MEEKGKNTSRSFALTMASLSLTKIRRPKLHAISVGCWEQSSLDQSPLNWDELDYSTVDLLDLDADITDEEIKRAILEITKENALGPDGLIGAFYSVCWEVIKSDLCQTVRQLLQHRGNTFNLLNTTNVVLFPKKDMADSMGDFRPISLVHNITKIFSKILALRLAPRLPDLVSFNQSAFVQKKCIHDNFVLVQSIIKDLHRRKTPTLFVKLDIAKAFDSVSWAYLLEVLENLGFGNRWCDWIAITLATSSSRILLNGIPGCPIKHERGLRQGDPMSPMLFILVIDPCRRSFTKLLIEESYTQSPRG
jgi:hypothetical protein